LEITLDKHSTNEALIKIKLNEADYQSKVESKLKDYAKKAVIKGFRPGKAPVSMVKNMYGTSILVDEINNLLGQSLNSYIKEQPFKILGDPLPVDSNEEKIDWKVQRDFSFEYKIGFIEPFSLELDKSLNGNKYSILVDDKLVSETIENLKQQNQGTLVPEVSEIGDSLYLDLANSSGTLKEDIFINTSKIPQNLAEKFIGISKDAVIELDSEEVKPEEWSEVFGISEEELKDVIGPFTFTVIEINRAIPAELNQEFFDKIFGPGVVSSEEEFKNRLIESLKSAYDRDTRDFSADELKRTLIDKVNISLPVNFLKEWLLRINEGKLSEAEVEKEFPLYANQLIWSLISNQVVTENNLKAEYTDVVEKTKEMIRQQFASSGLGSQLESSMDIFVDNYLRGSDGQNYSKMVSSVLDEKVLDLIQERINFSEKIITVEEFKELLQK
jgi:trigger factor